MLYLTQVVKYFHYFGYGANQSADMLAAIIGRKPKGISASVNNYELCVLSWQNIPLKIKKILRPGWGPGFRSYFIRPCRGKSVTGRVFKVTNKERRLIARWEIEGLWYQPALVEAIYPNGRSCRAGTQIIEDYSFGKSINGENYPTYLNGKRRMNQIAKLIFSN